MTQDLFQPPGDFGLSPLISCLPSTADSRQIASVRDLLVTRFERVASEVKKGRPGDSEYAMLRQVLEWLEVDTSKILASEESKNGD
jgi:hypothetical protein